MAIRIKSTNQYIKLDMGGCAFFPHGVFVSYTVFESEEKRKYHKNVQERIMLDIDKAWREWDLAESARLQAYADQQGLTKETIHTDKIAYAWLEKLQDIASDISSVRAGWDCNGFVFDKLKHKKELKLFGITDKFLSDSNRVYPSTLGVISGPHIDQRFTYECMYTELKKLFPDNYEDC